jgi:type VI secretion system secreted protein VgrG
MRVSFGEEEGGSIGVWGYPRSLELLSSGDAPRQRYRTVLVPALSRLDLTLRSRVFLDATVPQILSQVLTGHGFEDVSRASRSDKDEAFSGPPRDGEPQRRFAIRPASTPASYPVREYTVQYEETDLAFIRRLAEDVGLFSYVIDDPQGSTTVFADGFGQAAREARFRDLPYAPDTQLHDQVKPCITYLTERREVRPKGVVLVDYDWRNPEHALEVESRPNEQGVGLHTISTEHYREQAAGALRARVRAEGLTWETRVVLGTTTVLGFFPGARFSVQGYPTPRFDEEMLVVDAEWSVLQAPPWAEKETSRGFSCTFRALRFETRFRPSRTALRPRIDGILYAKVDGEEGGGHPLLDSLGRYKLVMPFDLSGAEPGKASAWVRMAQPHAGPHYGMHFPLKPGCEVVVAHVGGDPDRPVIVGATPNALNPSPVTSTNATMNVLRSASGISIELDDEAT